MIDPENSKCVDECGDGKVMKREPLSCDDGNKKNKDGCSSNCQIEFNWECSGGDSETPDICKNIEPPLITAFVLSKDPFVVVLKFTKKMKKPL